MSVRFDVACCSVFFSVVVQFWLVIYVYGPIINIIQREGTDKIAKSHMLPCSSLTTMSFYTQFITSTVVLTTTKMTLTSFIHIVGECAPSRLIDRYSDRFQGGSRLGH